MPLLKKKLAIAGVAFYCALFSLPASAIKAVAVVKSVVTPAVNSVDRSVRSVDRTLNVGFQESIKGQMQLLKGIGDLLDAQTKAFHEIVQAARVADARVLAEEEFGAHSAMLDECGTAEIGAAIISSDPRRRQGARQTRMVIKSHNREYGLTSKAVDRLAKIPADDPSLDAEALLPDDGTIPESQWPATVEYIKTVTNPFPPADLPEEQMKTRTGRKYAAVNKLFEAEMSLPQKALRILAENERATIPLGEWAQDQWVQMGHAGQMPGVDGKNISLNALLDLLAKRRFDAQGGAIETLNTKGLMREMFYLQTVMARIEAERYRMEQMRLAMEAVRFSRELRKDYAPALDNLAQGAISTVKE